MPMDYEYDDNILLDYYNTNIDFKNYVDHIRSNDYKNIPRDEELYLLYQYFQVHDFKKKKLEKKLNKESKFVFITIQTFQQHLKDLEKYKTFINNIKYLYSEGFWCLESGSVPGENCNLHLHMLVKIIQPRKHKHKLDLEFKKIFNMSIYDKDFYCLKQHNNSPKMPPYDQWVKEKKDYFDNEKKGNHSNSIELNCRGEWC